MQIIAATQTALIKISPLLAPQRIQILIQVLPQHRHFFCPIYKRASRCRQSNAVGYPPKDYDMVRVAGIIIRECASYLQLFTQQTRNAGPDSAFKRITHSLYLSKCLSYNMWTSQLAGSKLFGLSNSSCNPSRICSSNNSAVRLVQSE